MSNKLEETLIEYRSKLDTHQNITEAMKDALVEYLKTSLVSYLLAIIPEYELIKGDPSMPYNMSLLGYNTCLQEIRIRLDQDLQSLTDK